MSRLEPGAAFAGYTIERLLGAGGMGEVYVARHPRLPRSDALKVLAAQLADDDQFRRRFEREADVVAGFNHPNIVTVHDRGESDGRLWIALELINGQDLTARMKQGPVPVADTVRYLGEIAAALDAAAARGLVHRDVKPANILIDEHDRALLTDFGIASLAAEASELTGTGMTIGTVTYASPEQLLGKAVDSRADQYSLACTAFALLTGRPPYVDSASAAIVMAHLSGPIPQVSQRNPTLPPAADAVFQHALAKDPADRFPDSRAFASALAQALPDAPAPVPARPAPGPVPRVPESSSQVTAVKTLAPAGPSAPTIAGAPHAQTQLRGPAPGSGAVPGHGPVPPKRRLGRGVKIGMVAGILVVIVGLILAFTLPGSGHGSGEGDSARNDSSIAHPTDEAKGLKRQPVTPVLNSLEKKPTAPIWEWKPTVPKSFGNFLAATDKTLLALWGIDDGVDETTRLTLVDVDTGKTTRQVTGVPQIHPLGFGSCEVMRSQRYMVCGFQYDYLDKAWWTIVIDVEHAKVVTILPRGKDAEIFATTEGFIVADDSSVTAYTEDGGRRWQTPDTLFGFKKYPVGSPVIEASTADGAVLVSVADGRVVYRNERGAVSATQPMEWQPFLGGFAVEKAESGDGVTSAYTTTLYDATGRSTHQVADWRVSPYPLETVTSLPILNLDGKIAAFNPATGHELWNALATSDSYVSIGIDGVGTKAIVRYDRSGSGGTSYVAYDCYDGSTTYLEWSPGDSRVIGSDGTRIAITTDSGHKVTVNGGPGTDWSLNADSGDYYRIRGRGLYLNERRLT
ncbi:protein kinase domain-containing protein [Gordonia sp. (in: high G+C Gram-positive bacteria)]|uniref:serine/threonine-protein kinase n=1 Tax=unclassified Gordonia (in: high G+C Gram-positive bacteria) TaxID=2657482 RepID=UPI002606F967|nr:protein kinase [Gordonia sp. (in: high G+C Gram-positive bacteria)]